MSYPDSPTTFDFCNCKPAPTASCCILSPEKEMGLQRSLWHNIPNKYPVMCDTLHVIFAVQACFLLSQGCDAT